MAPGTYTINVNGGARTLTAREGQTLLGALEANEIFLPSACGGRGICGKCRLAVVSEAPEPNDVQRFHLSAGELDGGTRLACQIRPAGDLSVAIPDAVLRARRYQATVASKRRLTHDMLELRLDLTEQLAVGEHPGQFIRVEVPVEGGKVDRAYSISSTACEKGTVEMIVRLIPEGVGSLYIHGLEPGASVRFTGPYGDFRINEDPEVEVICVGGGSGMSAVKNVIYTIYERWPQRRCRLFFGCRGQRDIFYLDRFSELARKHPSFGVFYALSEPDPGQPWEGDTGFIHLILDREVKAGGAQRQAFLCGPPPMIDASIEVLKKKGLSDDDIYFDKF